MVPVGEENFSGTSRISTSRSTISTSLATWTAVNGLSPVIMTHYIRDRRKRVVLDERTHSTFVSCSQHHLSEDN